MGITVLSSPPAIPPLTSSTPTDVVTTAGAAGAANQAARGDHTHKLIDTGWLTPTLQNGWLVYDATFGNAAMYRKIANIVFCRGLIKSGTIGAAAFNLPAGFRPGIRMLYGVETTGAHARLDIAVNGDVIPNSGSNGYFQISVSFPADN